MRKVIVRLLVKALLYLLAHREEVKAVVESIHALDVRGERKRSFAMNQLRTKLPEASPRDLALAIELILQEA